VDNGMGIPKKIKSTTTVSFSNSISGYIAERNENRGLNAYAYTHIHSTIHSSQKMKAT
jgi:hypothetical protein